MKRTIPTNKRLYALITELGIDTETKEDMIYNFTNGRTIHSSELTEFEARQLIEKLSPVNNRAENSRKLGEMNQQLRRNIFKLMYDIGLINSQMDNDAKVKYINGWIKGKMRLDKELNALTFDELTLFIRQLQAVRRNYVEKTSKQVMYN